MKKLTLLVLSVLTFSIFAHAQVKFQNNRFSNIKVQPVKLVNANDFYSDYVIDEALQNKLGQIFTASDLKFITSAAHESALPSALNSLDNRNINRDKMKDLSLYKLCDFTSGGNEIVILVAPVSENQKAKSLNMIGINDMILFFDKSSVVETSAKVTPAKPISRKGYTCLDYADAILEVFIPGIDLNMPADSIPLLLPKAKLQPEVFDFKVEYLLQSNSNGLKDVTFVCDKNGDKPLYEMICQFDNADTIRKFTEMMFGAPNHPVLDNYWVLEIKGKNRVSLAWTFNNKLVIASNLLGTEMEDSEDFMLSDEFIAAFNGTENTTPANDNTSTDTDDNESTSLVVNNLIVAATNDFDTYKTELMPNKTAEYNAANYVQMGQEQAVVRKNAAGNWRLEVRFPSYETSTEALKVLENTINFYQTLEGLEYRLVKKSDLSTANGRTYIWEVQTMDDQPTGVILKFQSYPTSNGMFGIKMEMGK